jgi:hypothetical protein
LSFSSTFVTNFVMLWNVCNHIRRTFLAQWVATNQKIKLSMFLKNKDYFSENQKSKYLLIQK